MAGLVKAKKYDWKDSNLALFGTDTERNVRVQTRMLSRRCAREIIWNSMYGVLRLIAGEEILS